MSAYDDAVGAVADSFARKADKATGPAAEVLTASAGLARDKGLRGAVVKNVAAGQGLVSAVDAAVEQFVTIFTNMGGLMAERVTDLEDIERRVVAHLVGEPEPGVPTPSEPSVLVAEDLAPSDTSGLDPELIVALVTERGGATSHTAIIARQLGIPCVVGTAGITDLDQGAFLVVDGESGEVEVGGDPVDGRGPGGRQQGGARRPGRLVRAGRDVRRDRGQAARQRGRRPERGPGQRGAGPGGRALPHRALLPQRHRRAVGRGAGGHLLSRCWAPSARASTS